MKIFKVYSPDMQGFPNLAGACTIELPDDPPTKRGLSRVAARRFCDHQWIIGREFDEAQVFVHDPETKLTKVFSVDVCVLVEFNFFEEVDERFEESLPVEEAGHA